tara:strand:- start:66 stop:497 length:432 start_codon:yes stop_codon:yes gene_type:complete
MLSTSLLTSQILPTDGDSIYYSPKYCDTADSIEEALNSWLFSGIMQDCINPSEGMLNALWPNIAIKDTYDCCCKVASTPGLPGAFNYFEGSACETYLEGIGFIALGEREIYQTGGLYIDIYGRQFIEQPQGLSIMNRKKYYKL